MTASVNGDSDGSWGGISPVAVMSVFANRQSGVRGVLFHRKRNDRRSHRVCLRSPTARRSVDEKVVSEVT